MAATNTVSDDIDFMAFVKEVERGLSNADVGFYAYYYAGEGGGESGEGGAYFGCAEGLLVKLN
jgi:hypothetical protein